MRVCFAWFVPSLKGWRSVVAAAALIGILSPASAAAATIGFTGPYEVANWTFVTTFNVYTGGVDTSGAPAFIVMESDDFGDNNASNHDFLFTAFEAAVISFAWAYETSDIDGPSWDPFGYLLDGSFIQLTNNAGPDIQTGTTSFAVSAGQIFGFRARAEDSGFGPAVTTISDFRAVGVPEPASILLLGSGLFASLVARRRKKNLHL